MLGTAFVPPRRRWWVRAAALGAAAIASIATVGASIAEVCPWWLIAASAVAWATQALPLAWQLYRLEEVVRERARALRHSHATPGEPGWGSTR